MSTNLQITVAGQWLPFDSPLGDVEMSTVWPGGSGELSWTLDGRTKRRTYTGGSATKGYTGPIPAWGGQLVEPDPSQERMVAQGLWQMAEKFPAMDGAGNPSTIPNTAIDQAIALGLPWTRPTSISSTAVDLDTTQGPVTLQALLDAYTQETSNRWGVTPLGAVYVKADDTVPSWQLFATAEGLGYALDDYASGLVGRYKTSVGYATAIRTNAAAVAGHGSSYQVVDLTPRGVLTLAKANNLLDRMLTLSVAIPQWTVGIDVTYGELLTMGGVPVSLETVAAGGLLRIQSGLSLAQRLNGALYTDVLIGETQLSEGSLTMKPLGIAARSIQDFFTELMTRRS